MKNKSLSYYLAIILLIDVAFVFWKANEIISKIIEIQFLKDAFIQSSRQAFWFFGPSVFSIVLVTVSSVFLCIGGIQAFFSKSINSLLKAHLVINSLILIFCFPLTLPKSGNQLTGILGIKIFNSYVYALVILAEVVLYAFIKRKEVSSNTERTTTHKRRFFNLLIDTFVVLSIIFIVKDILFFNYNQKHVPDSILAIGVIFLYYFLTELLFKQSVGKIVTSTQVAYSGNAITQAMIRTLCRFIPFYQVSPLIGKKLAWHDVFSHTTVLENGNK